MQRYSGCVEVALYYRAPKETRERWKNITSRRRANTQTEKKAKGET